MHLYNLQRFSLHNSFFNEDRKQLIFSYNYVSFKACVLVLALLFEELKIWSKYFHVSVIKYPDKKQYREGKASFQLTCYSPSLKEISARVQAGNLSRNNGSMLLAAFLTA